MEEMQDLSAVPGGDGARMGLLSGAGARDRYHLCLIGQALMAACSWLFMWDRRRAFWWRLIGCVLLREGGGGWRAAPPVTERCAAD